MRFEYVFILIVVRITASFFIPISFPRHASQGASRVVLSADGNDDVGDDLLGSLDHFVSVVESLNKKHGAAEDTVETFQIVSRGSNDLPENERIATQVLYDPTRMEVFIAVFQENSEIDVSKICDLCSSNQIVPVPEDLVESLCGFPIETLPPLGCRLASMVSSCTIIFDESLIKKCQQDNLCMIGSAGHPYWKLLLTEKSTSVLHRMDHVLISSVIKCDEDEEDDQKGGDNEKGDQVWEVSSAPKVEEGIDNRFSAIGNTLQSNNPAQFSQKPYFPIDGPSINIARLVVRQKDISNPLSPVFLTAVGRIGDISIRTKRSLRCKFLPPSRNKKNSNEMNKENESFPWRSMTRNGSITVDLVFGKVFLQSLGAKQGERMIELIEEGQLLQIEAKTNPGQRESIEKWVDDDCLELVMMDCQLLSPDLGVGKGDNVENGEKSGKKKSEKSSPLPSLTLDNIFDKYASIKFVNDLESILEFSNDVSRVLSRSSSNMDPGSTSSLIGIDCEWQPREFMANPNLPQPVLLMQISFHELQKVYLLDLQALLRPLRPSDAPMNDVEKELSNALSPLMKSKRIVKVGYQLSSDLRRIFASYPHLPCFQEVHSALEISSFIKKVLHISKQKKSRSITTSLAAMTSHYLGMTVDKEYRKQTL